MSHRRRLGVASRGGTASMAAGVARAVARVRWTWLWDRARRGLGVSVSILVVCSAVVATAAIPAVASAASSYSWAQQSPATSPPALESASMADDPGAGQLVLFGGVNDSGFISGDTWTWDGTTWAQQSPATSPLARYGASMASGPGAGQLVLFGGQNNGTLGDTWVYQPAVPPTGFTTTLASPASTAVGNAWNDAATVTGNPAGGPPSGSVSFTLCQESTPGTACPGGNPVGTVTSPATSGDVSTFALPAAAAQAPSAVGTYCYNAAYGASAGGNYASATANPECFTVLYGFGGYLSPLPKTTLQKVGSTIPVKFTLATASGTAISPALASALAAAGDIEATLAGPGISPKSVPCGWLGSYFQCNLKTPSGLRTGTTNPYTITVSENVGTGFVTAPPVGPAVNPETVYFK